MQNKTWVKDYIGKPKKKTKIQEEVDKLVASAELPESWKEALQALASNSLTWQNKTITTGSNTQAVPAVSPNWQYTDQAQPQSASYPNWNYANEQPITRLFTPSNNGVFFPCE